MTESFPKDSMVTAFEEKRFDYAMELLEKGTLWNIERAKAFVGVICFVCDKTELFFHNWVDVKKRLPLQIVCREGSESDIRALLDNVDDEVWSLRTVKAFLRNPDKTIDCCMEDNMGRTPMSAVFVHLVDNRHRRSDLLPYVAKLLERAKNLGQIDKMTEVALFRASIREHIKAQFPQLYVKYCSSRPPSPVTMQLSRIPLLDTFIASNLP